MDYAIKSFIERSDVDGAQFENIVRNSARRALEERRSIKIRFGDEQKYKRVFIKNVHEDYLEIKKDPSFYKWKVNKIDGIENVFTSLKVTQSGGEIELYRAEFDRFLSSNTPGIICIRYKTKTNQTPQWITVYVKSFDTRYLYCDINGGTKRTRSRIKGYRLSVQASKTR